MSPLRPDLVETWVYRVVAGRPEILLLHRSPGRIFEGLWQGVSGGLEPGEPIARGALREVEEETAFGPYEVQSFYTLDQVNQFLAADIDSIVTAAIFAVRVRDDAEPRLSHEHDSYRWVSLEEAETMSVWPGYRESVGRIRDYLLDPERAGWFELTLDGRRTGL